MHVDYKLHIPGPVAVSEKTLRAMAVPQFGHRGSDFVKLYNSLQGPLQELFATRDPVYLSTSSAWGVMEGALRNLSRGKVLTCMNGAFSDKWFDVARRCGLEPVALRAEWGRPIEPEAVRKALEAGGFDAVTVIHNETSTGTMSDLEAVLAEVRRSPEIMSIVDTVSSFSAVPVPKDAWGIDVMLTGSQKALALPPGLALFSVSSRALARAAQIPGRGYYFDFVEFQQNHEKGMTPSTPVLPLILALASKLEDIGAEGIAARHARHVRLNERLRAWVVANGFRLLPEARYGSRTLVCVENTRGIDVAAFTQVLKARHRIVIDGGYGKLKGLTFRISNMGDETDASIESLVGALDDALAAVSPATAHP